MEFKLKSKYKPTGDQPAAIDELVNSIESGNREQTLLGVTGSGKTFTMANIIERTQRPTLVLAHNKTLAAQLCSEFKEFFPDNAVEYFVSYYDYYQPEAYIANTDTYIEKDSAVNDEIDKLRHSATLALSERRDVIIVASVSCIYSLGDPIDYRNMVISLRPGMEKSRDDLVKKLVELQYERNDVNFIRNKFRVRGDVVEIFPAASNDSIIRVEFFGDEIDRISEINPLTGELKAVLRHAAISRPASTLRTRKATMFLRIKWQPHSKKLTVNLKKDLRIFVRTENCLRHRELNSAHAMIWRCCRKSDFVRALRTIREFCRAENPVLRRLLCLTIFPRIFCCLLMSRMSLCRR